jgi:hypothetical protein
MIVKLHALCKSHERTPSDILCGCILWSFDAVRELQEQSADMELPARPDLKLVSCWGPDY